MQELTLGQDYEIIDDGMGDLQSYLERTADNATRKAISLIDQALSGRKGKAATMAILMADLASDRQAFNSAYKKYADAINQYFEYVDLNAAAKLMNTDEAIAKSLPLAIAKNLGILSAGILLGVASVTFFNRKNQ